MSKAKKFVDDLFKKEDTKTVTIKGPSNNKKEKGNFKRANTNVGVMNKFILQFSRVEKAYRLIEDAFILICRSETQRSLQERMKRKCKVKDLRPILIHLGFSDDCFTDDELKKIFDKDPKSDAQISFQRLLIGVGICHFTKLEKEKKAEQEKENSGTEVLINDDNDKKEDIIKPDDDDTKQTEEELRYKSLESGFKVVKNMFDEIDTDSSGEISNKEFEQAFTDICRDPEIVKERMKELDYNHDQNISFREFIFGISSWVGFNDEMIADYNDHDLDQPTSPSDGGKGGQ